MNYKFKHEIEKHPDKTQQLSYVVFWISVLVFLSFMIISCDQSFQPFKENDEYYFSIFGYLDAAADTQWVRVGEPRESINESPDPTGINVTLEHIQTGETVVMNDSLFTTRNALNYWTTFDIKFEQTYRIKVEREDGKSSHVTVTTPADFSTPIVLYDPLAGYTIYVDDSVKHLADIQTKWYVVFNPNTEKLERTYTFTYRNSVKHTTAFGGAYFINTRGEGRHISESTGRVDRNVLQR